LPNRLCTEKIKISLKIYFVYLKLLSIFQAVTGAGGMGFNITVDLLGSFVTQRTVGSYMAIPQ
jgi:hypothetical protein